MENKNKFMPGDTVRLTAGGPLMTVDSESYGEVKTIWFDGTKLKSAVFQIGAIHKEVLTHGEVKE